MVTLCAINNTVRVRRTVRHWSGVPMVTCDRVGMNAESDPTGHRVELAGDFSVTSPATVLLCGPVSTRIHTSRPGALVSGTLTIDSLVCPPCDAAGTISYALDGATYGRCHRPLNRWMFSSTVASKWAAVSRGDAEAACVIRVPSGRSFACAVGKVFQCQQRIAAHVARVGDLVHHIGSGVRQTSLWSQPGEPELEDGRQAAPLEPAPAVAVEHHNVVVLAEHHLAGRVRCAVLRQSDDQRSHPEPAVAEFLDRDVAVEMTGRAARSWRCCAMVSRRDTTSSRPWAPRNSASSVSRSATGSARSTRLRNSSSRWVTRTRTVVASSAVLIWFTFVMSSRFSRSGWSAWRGRASSRRSRSGGRPGRRRPRPA